MFFHCRLGLVPINVRSESVESQVHKISHVGILRWTTLNVYEQSRLRQCRNGCQELSVRIQTSRRWVSVGWLGDQKDDNIVAFVGVEEKQVDIMEQKLYIYNTIIYNYTAVYVKLLTVANEN